MLPLLGAFAPRGELELGAGVDSGGKPMEGGM